MKIQSFHILVPTKNKCVNHCPCCVSRLHENCENDRIGGITDGTCTGLNDYGKQILEDYKIRMRFVKENDCNFAVLTGTGEPMMNKSFLEFFGNLNKTLPNPFYSIDFQTSGVMLSDENLDFLRNKVGVTTIALSLFDIFKSGNNFDTLKTNPNLFFDIDSICQKIKEKGFNLRLSVMLTKTYNNIKPEDFFARIRQLKADFVTFKKLYKVEGNITTLSDKAKEINEWILQNSSSDEFINSLENYIIQKGHALNMMPFGAMRYSVDGVSTVVDKYCMGKKEKPGEEFKFLILKEDCRLYSEWDDEGSVIF